MRRHIRANEILVFPRSKTVERKGKKKEERRFGSFFVVVDVVVDVVFVCGA